MKRFIAMLAAAALYTGAAFALEIDYYNKQWNEVKAKAKAEHKYIFIDCYTDWCGWCKVMDKETMIDPAIISTMNGKFVAVKMDMEHGEGRKLSMKYHVSAFPTFMFFNPDGEFVYQSMGYQKPDKFKEELASALDKKKQFSAPGFTQNLDIKFPDFYEKAYAENGKRKFPEQAEVNQFLDKQKDLYSEVSWGVLSRFATNDKYTQQFFDNMPQYKKLYGASSVEQKVNSVINTRLTEATKAKDDAAFASVLTLVDKYVKEDAEAQKTSMRIAYYKGTKDWNKFTSAVGSYIATDKYENVEYINSLCWGMYENCDDKAALGKACSWMSKVVAKEPKYAYMDTYAAVLYKAGKNKEAAEWATKAIAAGKNNSEDVAATEALLKKINEGK